MQAQIASVADERDESGWHARLHLGLRVINGRTVLAERRRFGPLAVQRPFYPEDGVCHIYLLHPPGGVVGGDGLRIDVRVGAGAEALLTTPGATKFYRSGGARASQIQHLVVEDGATLEWLPQENIFFPGANVRLHTRVDLASSARILLSELQCLGRPAINETFDTGRVDSSIEIYRNGVPTLLERLRVDADNRGRSALLGGFAVSGTLIVGPADDAQLATCRQRLVTSTTDSVGATRVDDLLVVRYLGNSTQRAHALFRGIWERLRPDVLGKPACPPRIWAT